PPFPRFEIATLPADQVSQPRLMMEEANWCQNLEGDIAPSHNDYLHARLQQDKMMAGNIRGFFTRDRSPTLDVQSATHDGDAFGAFSSAPRQWDDDGNNWHRISQFIFPFHTMIAASNPDRVSLRS